jgi:hypothetical protein
MGASSGVPMHVFLFGCRPDSNHEGLADVPRLTVVGGIGALLLTGRDLG